MNERKKVVAADAEYAAVYAAEAAEAAEAADEAAKVVLARHSINQFHGFSLQVF